MLAPLLPPAAEEWLQVAERYRHKQASAADNAINSLNGMPYEQANAYALLTADGFSLATHKANAGTAAGGIFAGVGEVDIKAPGGSTPPGQAGPGLDRTVNGGNSSWH